MFNPIIGWGAPVSVTLFYPPSPLTITAWSRCSSVNLFISTTPPPCSSTDTLSWQVSTTKGTGGDVIILEEAAYVNPGFFYETVAPLLSIGSAVCAAI